MAGPTLVRNTLILSVQHPSEGCIFDQTVEPAGALLHRPIELLDLTGQVFTQTCRAAATGRVISRET